MLLRMVANGHTTELPLGDLSSSGDTAFTSVRAMLELEGWPTLSMRLTLSRIEGEITRTVCSTGDLPVHCSDGDSDSEWICMKLLRDPEGRQVRLLSHTHDADGWSFTFDVKEEDHKNAVLRNIHVLQRRQTASSLGSSDVDCTTCSPSVADADPSAASAKAPAAVEAGDTADAGEMIAAMSNRSFLIRRLTGSAAACGTSETLGQLLSGEASPPEAWLHEDMWREIARDCDGLGVDSSRALDAGSGSEGGKTDCGEMDCGAQTDGGGTSSTNQDAALTHASELLSMQGYAQMPPAAIGWAAAGVSVEALAVGIERLGRAGFPPVFIFMYDEAWLLCAAVGSQLRALMGPDAELDEACFAWALSASASPPPQPHLPSADEAAVAATPPQSREQSRETSHIGSNFGKPHRDSSYAASHTSSGAPSEISVWVPLNDVTTTNGCMLVVPANRDPLFAKPADPMHMQPHLTMPWAHVRALPCDAGSVLLWHASLIHWGSSCAEGELRPRRSIAFAFKLPMAGESASRRGGGAGAGRLSRETLRRGLNMQERLRLVVKSLLQYEHWHPTFRMPNGEQFSQTSLGE